MRGPRMGGITHNPVLMVLAIRLDMGMIETIAAPAITFLSGIAMQHWGYSVTSVALGLPDGHFVFAAVGPGEVRDERGGDGLAPGRHFQAHHAAGHVFHLAMALLVDALGAGVEVELLDQVTQTVQFGVRVLGEAVPTASIHLEKSVS